MNFEEEVRTICGDIADMLILKNQAYGNSALEPVRIFSKADPLEQIKVRIDDKLSRLMHGKFGGVPEDTIGDLIGYLILLKIAGKQEGRQKERTKILDSDITTKEQHLKKQNKRWSSILMRIEYRLKLILFVLKTLKQKCYPMLDQKKHKCLPFAS